jgi:hypothetical protein
MRETQSDLDKYLEGLIVRKFDRRGYDLEPEIREEIKKDTTRQLDELIMARAIDKLSDRDVNRLNEILTTTRSVESAQDFIAKHVPHFTDFLTKVLLEFENVYMAA